MSLLSRECKGKVEDAILARDQANAVCVTLRREVGKLLEGRKEDAANSAVQHEQLMDAMRERMGGMVEAKERDIHELTVANSMFKGTAERNRREKLQAEETYQKLRAVLETERANQRNKFAESTRRINEAESRCEVAEAQLKQNSLINKSQLADLEARDEKLVELQALVDKERDEARLAIDVLKGRVRESEERCESRRFEVEKLNVLIDEARNTTSHKLQEVVKRLELDVDQGKLELETSRASARERENSIQAAIEAHNKGLEKVRGEKERMVETLEKKLAEEREIVSRMTQRNQELGVRVNMLAAEKSELSLIAIEAEGKLEELESRNEDIENQVRELSNQLSANVLDQQQRVREREREAVLVHRRQLPLIRRSI